MYMSKQVNGHSDKQKSIRAKENVIIFRFIYFLEISTKDKVEISSYESHFKSIFQDKK